MHETSKIVPAEGEREDVFGASVAISSGGEVVRVVIGAAQEDDREHNTGAAYVLRYDPQSSGWVQEAKLLNDDGEEWGLFGQSVSIFGDTIVVGSGNLQNGFWPGAAHVFRRDRDDSRWLQEAELLAFGGGEDDRFGKVVRISGDVVVVGAERADNFSGAAYVFRFDGKTWGQEAKLTSNVHGLWFGNAVGASGDRVIVGAQRDGENAYWAGAAYVFRFDGKSWIREAKLLADDGEENDWFGSSVAISGDVALVGAKRKRREGGGDAGAAYFFRFNSETKRWVQEAKLLPQEGPGREFGKSVDLSGNLAVIGLDDYERDHQSGAAYVARFGEGGWARETKLFASVGGPQQWFGGSVGIAGETVVVGAPGDGENGYESGAAFVFHELFSDCNDNGRPDLCDTFDGTSGDCNDNRIPDECDIASGTSEDTNEDGVPDECQGACCVREGVCTDFVTEEDCQGRYAAQTACDALDPPCTEVTGACCERDGNCEDEVPLSRCGGTFEDNTLCRDLRPRCVPHGACCDPIGTCEDDVRRDECSEQFSPLVLCEDLDPACGAELGACCIAEDCMGTNRFAECEESGGHWFRGEDCNAGFECPLGQTCPVWDNDIVANGFSGRAISPPNFPDIRVADDFVIPEGGCTVRSVQVFVLEDAGWYDSGDITITIYEDTEEGGPGEIVAQVTTYYDRERVEENCGWHRDCYVYLTRDLDISLPSGSYWLGVRNPHGGGTGTNYWMTSDGGEDGRKSDTGWFSLNGGETWSPEGAGWHHAFEINTGDRFGACCQTDGGCSDYVHEDDCDDRYLQGVLCEDLEPGFCTGACCSPDGTCEDFVSQDDCDRRQWEQGQQCEELSPPCEPYCPAYEAAKILAPDRPERHRFGASIALAHRTLAVGTNRAGGGTGLQAVHIYQLEGTHWRWEAALTPPEEVREGFGWPIGLDRSSGNRVVAGVPRREEPGIAYVFRRGVDGWALEGKLVAVGGSSSDGYGAAVAVFGDVIAVAARGDDERGRSAGAVHMYRLREGRWQFEQKVFASDPSPHHSFGARIALGRDILAIGATLDSERASHAGAFYTLRYNGKEWVHEEKLFSGNPREADQFPRSIALWGNTIAAADFGVFDWRVGSVFIYERGPGGWARVARLIPDAGAHNPQVAINGRFVVIGSAAEHRYEQGSGTAYVFEKVRPGSWEQIIELEPSDSTYNGAFGSAVAVAGEIIAVGAQGDDELGPLAGAAYLFRGFSADCNNNQQTDICDISQGIVPDENANGLPDDCEGACCVDGGCALMTATECAAGGCERNPLWNCDGDVDGDGQVNPVDAGLVAGAFGSTREGDLCSYDLDCNGRINPTDVGIVQSLFGECHDPRSACGAGTWTEGVDCGDFQCP